MKKIDNEKDDQFFMLSKKKSIFDVMGNFKEDISDEKKVYVEKEDSEMSS